MSEATEHNQINGLNISDEIEKMNMYQTLFLLKYTLEHLDRELDKPMNEITDAIDLRKVVKMWDKHAKKMIQQIDLSIMPYAVEELYNEWKETEVMLNDNRKTTD